MLKEILYHRYEKHLLKKVLQRPPPRHLGLIQDGHRRYARHVRLSNQEGYRHGAAKAKEVLTWCAELRIPMVRLWWLSTENLAREPDEVTAVLSVIEEGVSEWLREGLTDQLGIQIRPIGKLELLPASTHTALQQAEATTRDHDRMLLNVGVGYGGRQEIVDAVGRYISDSVNCGVSLEEMLQRLTPDMLDKYLYTYDCPDPDLIIGTSGEVRLSGFMFGQSAYIDAFCPPRGRVQVHDHPGELSGFFWAAINILFHLETHLSVVIQDYGLWTYLILFLIILCETGLVMAPFLPGDSLLFAVGTFSAVGAPDLGVVIAGWAW